MLQKSMSAPIVLNEAQRPCKPEENSQTPAMYVLVIRVSVA
jgi:hypothetical protein